MYRLTTASQAETVWQTDRQTDDASSRSYCVSITIEYDYKMKKQFNGYYVLYSVSPIRVVILALSAFCYGSEDTANHSTENLPFQPPTVIKRPSAVNLLEYLH